MPTIILDLGLPMLGMIKISIMYSVQSSGKLCKQLSVKQIVFDSFVLKSLCF